MKDFSQFVRFVVVGLLTVGVDLAALRALLLWGFVHSIAVAGAFLLGFVVNLLLHKFFTFRDSRRLHVRQVMRFAAVAMLNLALTEVIVLLAVSSGWGVFPGKVLSLPVVTAVGFLLSKRWVFKKADLAS